jgi:glycosyltransferase involved in cell wall biosynthesis
VKIVVTGTRGIPNIMGGVETHCEELYPRLAQLGFDVTVMRRHWYAKDNLKEWNHVHIVDINAPKKKSIEAIVHTLRAVWKAKRMHADVLHIHALGPALVTPIARLLGLKVVFTHHGADYERDKWGATARLALKWGERLGVRYSNEVIAISQGISDMLKQKYGRGDCHLIRNGAPIPSPTDLPSYFSELGIERGQYILAMCRFVPEKKLEDLVKAYSLLKASGKAPKMRLVLAGDADFEDDYSRRLKEEARKCGAVLTGFVKGKQLHALLTGARCYVMPSSHEGLSIALLEAMGYGLPVIISDIEANREVGLDAASYYPLGDIRTLARKIETVCEQPPHPIHYDMTKYDWDIIARQVANVYQSLMK